jgi:mannosyltransferase OCH1-like enzyme
MLSIPQKLWHIWIGPNPAPTKWMRSWQEHHPGWKYVLLDQQQFESTRFKNQHLIDEYYRRGRYNGVADLIRYELLLEHGGFIPPADAVCYHNTDELWKETRDHCYTVYENEQIRPGFVSPIYAANPGNEFVQIIVDTLHQLRAEDLSDEPWESTGNGFLKELIAKHEPKIKIFPSHYFIPEHFLLKEQRYTGSDKVYADQLWGSTNKDWADKDVYIQGNETKPAKLCVYAIALNEIKFVDEFMRHCQEADLVLVCDTGSTDGTPERLRELGAIVYNIKQTPWRFDIPRNTALNLVPSDIDICLSIDLDEFLQPGWVEAIQTAWQENAGAVNRISYDYIWNWQADGVTPDVRFYADKIHHRHGYRWRHPCHETLYYDGSGKETRITLTDVVLHHHADPAKSRGHYLPLLKMAVDEDPDNDRMSHYYGRELMFRGQWTEAITELQRHLSLPAAQWREERAASLRFIARCYKNLKQTQESQDWAVKGTLEWPWSREPWLELSRSAYANKDWQTCYWAITKCLGITERKMTYMSDGASWGYEPHDHAALSSYYLGFYQQAFDHGLKALELSPKDKRLQKNLEFYQEKL